MTGADDPTPDSAGGFSTLRLTVLSAKRRVAGLREHGDVIGSASALLTTTLATSALGFVYWAVAARLFSQQAVGYGSAAISVMALLGTIGMIGLGTVLMAELPLRRSRGRLVAAALAASAVASAVLGAAYVVVAPRVSPALGVVTHRPIGAVIFVVGVALTGTTFVFDQASIGLRRSSLQVWRNVIFALSKIVLLILAAVAASAADGLWILGSWVGGTAISVLSLAVLMRIKRLPLWRRPHWSVLSGLGRTTLAHNWLNLAAQAPRLLMPLVVTGVVSASANGAFYAAWTLISFLFIVPTHLSTALFAIASGDEPAMGRKTRMTLMVSVALGLPASVILALGAPLLLRLFGSSYEAAATVPLQLLTRAYLPTVVKTHYIAAQRVLHRIPRAAAVLMICCISELAAAGWGAHRGGLTGLSVWLVGAMAVEAVLLAPTVWRVASVGRKNPING